jgi:hypothetical protein
VDRPVEVRIDPALLWGRAAVVGLIAFGLGVLGHISADGLLPGPAFLVALAVGSVLFTGPMLARRASSLRLVVLVVGGQTVTHLGLSLTAGHAGDPRPPASPGSPYLDGYAASLPVVDGHRVGSLLDAYRVAVEPARSSTPSLPGHLVADLSAHAPMMTAHLVASALVALWLAHGERALWTVIALTGRRILAAWAFAPVAVTPVRRLVAVADRVPEVPRSAWLARPLSRRGPPLAAVP